MSIDYNKIEKTLARLEAAQAVPKGDTDWHKIRIAEYEAMKAVLPLMQRLRKLALLRILIGSGELRNVEFAFSWERAYIVLQEMTRPRG